MEALTKNPGGKAGVSVQLGGEPDRISEFQLQAQALAAKLSVPHHLARCYLYLIRGDVW